MGSRSHFKLTLLSTSVTVCALALAACGNAQWHEVPSSNTGDVIADQQKVPNTTPLQPGQDVHVSSDRLPGRTNPSAPIDESTPILDRNDTLRVIDPNPKGKEGYVEVVVVDTKNPNKPAEPVYVPREFVSPDPVAPTNEQKAADRYFMIQNIATEKVRVYETCGAKKTATECVHRMILEADMTAGEDTPTKTKRTILGSYRVSQWFKFYEDKRGLFPSWYSSNLPELPAPGASIQTWMSQSLLPNGKGSMRGSFGWYTAHLEPNASEQWTHGTFGWGADGDRYIQMTRDPGLNIIMDPRSQGCTRLENQAIAFVREIMPRGARIIKIYAKEAYRDEKREQYANLPMAKWDWILTKEGINSKNAPTSAKAEVENRKVPSSEILESGTYLLDQMPDAVPLTNSGDPRSSGNGNLYDIDPASFKGVFVVDEGRLVGYSHPKELKVGGHADHQIPSIMISTDSKVVYPKLRTKPAPVTGPVSPSLPSGAQQGGDKGLAK